MSNPFNLSRDSDRKEKKEKGSLPYDAPDVIAPTKFTSSQNSLRRRTMTGADMINSQPLLATSTRDLKRQRLDNSDLLDNPSYGESKLRSYPQELPTERPSLRENPLYASQQQYRPYPREELNIYDQELSQNELIERNRMLQNKLDTMMRRYKELSDLRYTEAEEIAYKMRLNEGFRDEAYAHMEKAVEELLSKGLESGSSRILVEKLQEENQNLKEQLREQRFKNEQGSANNLDQINSTLALYEGLTCLRVTGVKKMKDGELYECLVSGKIASHKFTLLIPTDPSKLIEYTPTSENVRILSTILPDFLLEEIDFTKDNLPVFFWRLASTLHPKP